MKWNQNTKYGAILAAVGLFTFVPFGILTHAVGNGFIMALTSALPEVSMAIYVLTFCQIVALPVVSGGLFWFAFQTNQGYRFEENGEASVSGGLDFTLGVMVFIVEIFPMFEVRIVIDILNNQRFDRGLAGVVFFMLIMVILVAILIGTLLAGMNRFRPLEIGRLPEM